MAPSDSSQLDLWDGSGVRGVELSSLPWSGASPRGLTRVALSPIFQAQAAKSVSDSVSDLDQLDFWLTKKRAPGQSQYLGAPTLLPLEV